MPVRSSAFRGIRSATGPASLAAVSGGPAARELCPWRGVASVHVAVLGLLGSALLGERRRGSCLFSRVSGERDFFFFL